MLGQIAKDQNVLVTIGSLRRSRASIGSDGIALGEVLKVLVRNPEHAVDNLLTRNKG